MDCNGMSLGRLAHLPLILPTEKKGTYADQHVGETNKISNKICLGTGSDNLKMPKITNLKEIPKLLENAA